MFDDDNINIFPVADGDTGTNLYTTLRAMVEKPQRERSFADMLRGISKSGLESARGNSGIIFASFINGIAQECQPAESVDVAEFSGIAYRAVRHLYAAVEHQKPLMRWFACIDLLFPAILMRLIG